MPCWIAGGARAGFARDSHKTRPSTKAGVSEFSTRRTGDAEEGAEELEARVLASRETDASRGILASSLAGRLASPSSSPRLPRQRATTSPEGMVL